MDGAVNVYDAVRDIGEMDFGLRSFAEIADGRPVGSSQHDPEDAVPFLRGMFAPLHPHGESRPFVKDFRKMFLHSKALFPGWQFAHELPAAKHLSGTFVHRRDEVSAV